MPAGFWDELLWSSRNVTDDLRRAGVEVPVEFDVFAAGSRDARDTAFAEGYAAGRIEECRLALGRGGN
jgi:predicted metalloprotease